ncbi:SUN3 protein, partial [Atlantisia rogersi]|nr:SUN3 protein [Atlantisia rogersi]
TSPGYCWTSPTSQSHVVIRLPTHVQPTAITLQHPLMKYSVLGDISSAPRDFSVFVSVCQALGAGTWLAEEDVQGPLAAPYISGVICLFATFSLQEVSGAFQYIKLFIQNNWGNRRHTCIYRVQVDGRIKKMNAKGQA